VYVIGLTGNIACGKSTVAQMLAALGAEVIDADALAHEAMRRGTEVHAAVAARFGPCVLQEDGEIERRALGRIVFADGAALADLERLVHPAVIGETLRRLAASTRPVVVVEAIKLLEAQMHRHCQAVWVVTCPRRVQLARLMATRRLTREEAEARVRAQPPQRARSRRADVVIPNGARIEETWRQVVRHWNAIPNVAPIAATAACPIQPAEVPVA
jgi:dephospho-CoA kinase